MILTFTRSILTIFAATAVTAILWIPTLTTAPASVAIGCLI